MSRLRTAGRLIAAMLLVQTGAGAAQASGNEAAPTWRADPETGCRFVAPRSMPAGRIHWIGECPEGQASGPGMLRRREGGQAAQAFYGEMKDGVPVVGAIDMSDGVTGGYVIGRYDGGDLSTREGVFQDRMDAFDTAARAARTVSAHYAARGNASSAAYYARQAEMLDEQIE